jgi:hypothetical protein
MMKMWLMKKEHLATAVALILVVAILFTYLAFSGSGDATLEGGWKVAPKQPPLLDLDGDLVAMDLRKSGNGVFCSTKDGGEGNFPESIWTSFTWKVENGRIEITVDDKTNVWDYTISGSTLTLTDGNTNVRYTKLEDISNSNRNRARWLRHFLR